VSKTPLICCKSLGFQSNSLLIQKLELSLGFGTLKLQKFVGFFLMGLGASIMDTNDCGLLIYCYPFCVHLFVDFGQFLGFCVSEMVIPNGYHFLFNLLFPSFILILHFEDGFVLN
jgi:hypothetical protein